MSLLLWRLKTGDSQHHNQITPINTNLHRGYYGDQSVSQPESITTLYWFKFDKSSNEGTKNYPLIGETFRPSMGEPSNQTLWWTFGYDSLNLNEDVFIICVRLNLVEFNQCEIYAKCIWSQRSKDWIVDYVGSLTLIVGLCKVSRFRTSPVSPVSHLTKHKDNNWKHISATVAIPAIAMQWDHCSVTDFDSNESTKYF